MGLDLGYAPPFAIVIDVVIHGANTLENKRHRRVSGIQAQELWQRLGAGKRICLLDVREQEEFENLPLKTPGVFWILLGKLRQRWREIPLGALVVAVCNLEFVGMRPPAFSKAGGFPRQLILREEWRSGKPIRRELGFTVNHEDFRLCNRDFVFYRYNELVLNRGRLRKKVQEQKGVLSMYIVSLDEELCSGCNECASGCPARLLKFNGEKTEVVGDATECMGCESCTTVCPTGAVQIQEV